MDKRMVEWKDGGREKERNGRIVAKARRERKSKTKTTKWQNERYNECVKKEGRKSERK